MLNKKSSSKRLGLSRFNDLMQTRAAPPLEPPPQESMGLRIKERRERMNLTQEGLAELVGVTKGAISQWESGLTKNIKFDPFARLLRVLEVDYEFLVFGHKGLPPLPIKIK